MESLIHQIDLENTLSFPLISRHVPIKSISLLSCCISIYVLRSFVTGVVFAVTFHHNYMYNLYYRQNCNKVGVVQ